MTELSEILQALASDSAGGGVLATLVTAAGSSYRRPGARLLVTTAGRRIGSISGGCLEEDVMARAAAVAQSGRAELITYDTSAENDLVWGVGLGCHGVVQILIERLPPAPPWVATLAADQRAHRATALAIVWQSPSPAALGTHLAAEFSAPPDTSGIFFDSVRPPPRLVVFGAGDDARPLAELSKALGWHITIADPRSDFATAGRFPGADALIVAPAVELVARAAPPADALAVVMTHRYLHDVPVLRALLPLSLPYVGLLGPRARADRILADLGRDGLAITDGQRARLHAPVGLDLGAETPAEVALSIVAEMRAVLAQRTARPLRERTGPIHRPT